MTPGDEMVLRATGERVRIVAVLDASGTALVATLDDERFQAAADELEAPWERHAGCGCC